MKKLLAYILCLSLLFAPFPAVAFDQLMGMQQPVVYRGTVTGLLVSAVDGTAFIDGANASITALADGNHQIEIYDSAGRMIKGVLKAAGTGAEGLGATLNVSNLANSVGYPYNTFTGADPAGFHAHGLATVYSIANTADEIAWVDKGLFKITSSVAGVSGEYPQILARTGSVTPPDFSPTFQLAEGGNTNYFTSTGTATGVLQIYTGLGASQYTLSVLVIKQTTTPSTSGSTIVTQKGGTVQNFNYKAASFTYNAASYYVIVKKLR